MPRRPGREVSFALADLLALASAGLHADAFVPSTPSFAASRSSPASVSALSMAGKSLVVISPPGGVGEVAAVAAAKSGNAVRWFVVNAPDSKSSVQLPSSTLEAIDKAGGKVELAGADSDSLLLPADDSSSAVGAVGRWCGAGEGNVDALIATMDGAEEVEFAPDTNVIEGREALVDAVKVAAREAAGVSRGGRKVAILPAPTPGEGQGGDAEEEEGGGIGGALGSLFGGGGKADVPASLGEAVGTGAAMLRHGELFGLPETSPEASPFVGGPRREPVLREEYTLRGVRIDPTISASGAAMMGSATRSSRLSVGEAAALVALAEKDLAPAGSDVCLTSLLNSDAPTVGEWEDEFNSAAEAVASGAGATLFKTKFESVPDTERLADWLATKWAPAVMRTYDIAGIRIGARPVAASRAGEGKVEISWQKLEDFESVRVGSMTIEVDGTSITAQRGAGDPAKGYGQISMTPLNGEDVLVRRLADAASQAVEKGLAQKAAKVETKKASKPQPKVVAATPAVSTVAASGTVEQKAPAASEAGPRAAGARRSSERTRGRRRKAAPPKSGDIAAPAPAKPEEPFQ